MSSLAQLGDRKFVAPAEKINRGLIIGIPSLGMVPTEFAISLGTQHMPINFGAGYCYPTDVRWDWIKNTAVHSPGQRQLPVADARNCIAEFALKNNIEWLFFRDDDTVAPPDAVNKLFTLYRDALDRGVPVACIGGNYMSKQVPPHSLILVDGYLGGFEDWNMGDVVGGKNTAIGMGCTLLHIPTTIAKIPPPWFKTVDTLDPSSMIYSNLARGLVAVGNDIQDVAPGCVKMTEDVYYCKKASKYGLTNVYCDTGVQCVHIDIHTGRRYFYHAALRRGAWQDGDVISWYLRPGEKFDPSIVTGIPNPIDPQKKPEIVRFDLGTPGKKEGWITVDLYEPTSDEQVDITNMKPLIDKYGKADAIRASHILEHFSFKDTARILKEWVSALKPGGTIFIEVPDLEDCVAMALAAKGKTPDLFMNQVYKIYGGQSNPGDLHKTGFTIEQIRYWLEDPTFELEDVQVEHFQYPSDGVQRAVRGFARKKNVLTPAQKVEAEKTLVLVD